MLLRGLGLRDGREEGRELRRLSLAFRRQRSRKMIEMQKERKRERKEGRVVKTASKCVGFTGVLDQLKLLEAS